MDDRGSLHSTIKVGYKFLSPISKEEESFQYQISQEISLIWESDPYCQTTYHLVIEDM